MNRNETVTLTKELLESRSIVPIWISMEKNKGGTYKLKIKTFEKTYAFQEFIKNNNLLLEDEKGYCLISKP